MRRTRKASHVGPDFRYQQFRGAAPDARQRIQELDRGRPRERALRRQLSSEFPESQTYADGASTARYYEATMLGRMGRWEEALVLHRDGVAEHPEGSFICRVGEALAALGRREEALPYFTTALQRHERELRADTAMLQSGRSSSEA